MGILQMQRQMRAQIPISNDFECSTALEQHDWLNAAGGVRG